MAEYLHGIHTSRDASIVTSAAVAASVQAVVGTAPVNLLDDPSSAVNKPILVRSRNDVKQNFGVCTDYKNYTLMQTMLASFMKVGVQPVVMINVLDPSNSRHTTAVAAASYELTKGIAVIETQGVLLASVKVMKGEVEATLTTDYELSFDTSGNLVVSVTSDGALKDETEVSVSFKKLNPAGVTATDVIGGITAAGVRSGIELFDEIYSTLLVIPGVLSAPGFSTDPAVAAALEAKAELTGDLTNAIAVIDLESTTTKKIEDVKNAKTASGIFSRWCILCWPKVLMGGVEIYASAAVAALAQYSQSQNNDIPTSTDNKTIAIEGVVLEDGTEKHYTQKQVNEYLNANGVVSFIYLGGWKCWGNNTAAYPDKTEPNNRFLKCVMISNYLENRFKTEYLSCIGQDASYKMIDSVVNNFNASLNALVPDYLAGAEVIFDKNENPIAQILEGRFKFHTRYADWTPAEYIDNTFTWDSQILESALTGGEEE